MTGSIAATNTPIKLGELEPRLVLHAAGSTTGQVDGAWWPRSNVLAEELPGLLAVLTERIGPVERLSYDMADWAPADRRLSTGGRRVRLDGFRRRAPAGAVHAVGTTREVITLLVIPQATPTAAATAVLDRAADPTVTIGALRAAETGDQVVAGPTDRAVPA